MKRTKVCVVESDEAGEDSSKPLEWSLNISVGNSFICPATQHVPRAVWYIGVRKLENHALQNYIHAHKKNIQKYYSSTSQIYATRFNHETSNNVNITLSRFRRGLLHHQKLSFLIKPFLKKKKFFFILPTQNLNNLQTIVTYYCFSNFNIIPYF